MVEDQPAVAKALRVLLEIHDIPCATASHPAEALDMIDREEFGAVLQDMALTIHPHPTLSETVGMAAEAFEGTITDLYMPKHKH